MIARRRATVRKTIAVLADGGGQFATDVEIADNVAIEVAIVVGRQAKTKTMTESCAEERLRDASGITRP